MSGNFKPEQLSNGRKPSFKPFWQPPRATELREVLALRVKWTTLLMRTG
jgi:hypothetical protein